MKIIHVVYSLEMGGAEVLVAQLCEIQRSHGHQVSICAYSSLGSVGEKLRANGFDIYVPGEGHPALTMLRYLKHFRAIRPDVVHCHNPAPTIQAALGARLAGVGCIVSTRHSLVAPPYNVAEEKKYSLLARFCDHITGICEITCNNLRGAPGAHPEKIACVYNGANALQRVPVDDLQKCGFTLLFVGRLAAIKNLSTILYAVSQLKDRLPNLNLWLVGDGPERSPLEALTAQLSITNRVRFWGQRFDTERFFSAADLFVMSSVSEGLPMSLLQAMSLGLPALLSDVGGMAEVVRLSQGGLLFPVDDPAAMADAILRMAADPALMQQLSEKALASYEAHFTLEKMYDAYAALYASGRS